MNQMGKKKQLYGINLEDTITPLQVRDAIIQCFYEAHDTVLNEMYTPFAVNSKKEKQPQKYKHVEMLIRKMFNDVNEDFHHPTKTSLLKVIDQCANYAENFRDKEIIEKHYQEIKEMIDLLN